MIFVQILMQNMPKMAVLSPNGVSKELRLIVSPRSFAGSLVFPRIFWGVAKR